MNGTCPKCETRVKERTGRDGLVTCTECGAKLRPQITGKAFWSMRFFAIGLMVVMLAVEIGTKWLQAQMGWTFSYHWVSFPVMIFLVFVFTGPVFLQRSMQYEIEEA